MNSININRLYASLFLALVICTIMYIPMSCYAANPETTTGQKTVRVVMDDNYPPYAFRGDKGELKGILVDQWGLWEKQTGVRAVLTGMDWNDAQRRMQAGEFDVIDTIFRNEQREQLYEFSKPYAQIAVPLFFHDDISGIRGPDDLKGFLVAAKAGDNSIDILKKHGVTNIVAYPSYEKLIEAARDDKARVFTVDRPPALYYLNKMAIQNHFRETKPLYTGEFHRAVLKGRTDLLAVVENGFARIPPAQLTAIDKLWMGNPLQSTHYFLYGLYCLGGITALVLVLSIWLVVLKRVVASKTAELRKSEENIRAIIDVSPVPLALNDAQGNVTYLNKAYGDLIGYTLQDIPTVADWWPRAYPDAEYRQSVITIWQSNMDEALRTGNPFKPMEVTVLCKDGLERTFICSTAVLENNVYGSQIVIFYDISEHKYAEEENLQLLKQLHQAQKIEAIGRLAGGVAHDFNNMLSVILGHAEMALMRIKPEHPIYASLLEISNAAKRSANLTRQLLAFARKQTVSPKVLDLNEAVAGMLKMLQRLIGENIHLTWKPGANLWPTLMDSSQVDQILANLCVNARDAIADVGEIIIETGNCVVNASYCETHPYAMPGEYVKIVVSDSGKGMDKETLDHIFEPFFTTKSVGEGTGLGLATVYGIVRQNNGFVNVYSEPGSGTTFTIYFPRYKGVAEGTQKEVTAKMCQRGHETILLVEDEAQILEMTTLILQDLGYTVLAAGTPAEAIRLGRQHAEEIHLVMTDVIMPEMNGRDLAEKLRAINPRIKFLFMSGYTADIIAHHGVLEEGVNFIQKPFQLNALAEKLREVLDEKL